MKFYLALCTYLLGLQHHLENAAPSEIGKELKKAELSQGYIYCTSINALINSQFVVEIKINMNRILIVMHATRAI